MDFVAELEELEESVVIVVSGEIDMDTIGELSERFEEALQRGSPTVVLDLAGTEFMDSTGLGVIVRASRQLERTGSTLVLRAPQPTVRRLLRVTGLERLLRIEE